MKDVKDMKRPEIIVVAKMVGVSVGRKSNEDLIKEIIKVCNDLNLKVLRSERGISVEDKPSTPATPETKRTHKYGTRIVDNFHSQVYGVR